MRKGKTELGWTGRAAREGGGMRLWSAGEYHAGAVIELWERHENAKQSDKADNVAVNLLSR